jgi:hypothetical protein
MRGARLRLGAICWAAIIEGDYQRISTFIDLLIKSKGQVLAAEGRDSAVSSGYPISLSRNICRGIAIAEIPNLVTKAKLDVSKPIEQCESSR